MKKPQQIIRNRNDGRINQSTTGSPTYSRVNDPPTVDTTIGASDLKKRDPEVFRPYFLERPPHPPGGCRISKEENHRSLFWWSYSMCTYFCTVRSRASMHKEGSVSLVTLSSSFGAGSEEREIPRVIRGT